MPYDLLVVGAGPAGLSAAIYARARNKSVLVVSNDPTASPLCKAHQIDNYPGMGAEFRQGRVLTLMPLGDSVMASIGDQVEQATAVVLAPGVARATPLPGEEKLLGRGVSYCATCDGMFYRGKQVVVAGDAPDLAEETEYLRSIGCEVTSVRLPGLHILGEDQVTGVCTAKGEEIPCQGVFLLRASIAPTQLAPGLELDGNYVKVNSFMATNLPGIYAAGDCTGQPLQLAKAVGEGQIAAHHALGL